MTEGHSMVAPTAVGAAGGYAWLLIFLGLIEFVSVCIEEIILVGSKRAVINERRFGNRHDRFTDYFR